MNSEVKYSNSILPSSICMSYYRSATLMTVLAGSAAKTIYSARFGLANTKGMS